MARVLNETFKVVVIIGNFFLNSQKRDVTMMCYNEFQFGKISLSNMCGNFPEIITYNDLPINRLMCSDSSTYLHH